MQYSFTTYVSYIFSGHIQADDFSYTSRKGAFALLIGLFFFIISIAGYAGLYYLNKSQETTQGELILQVERKEEDLRPKVLDEIFSLQKKIKSISAVLSSHPFSGNTFSLIERDAHPQISFASYNFSPRDNKISLKGEAENYAVIAQQIAFFEGDKEINKVEFGGLALKDNRRVTFSLTIYVMPTLTAALQ